MKRTLRARSWTWLCFSLLLLCVTSTAAEVSIQALVANPTQFDGQTVTLRGTEPLPSAWPT